MRVMLQPARMQRIISNALKTHRATTHTPAPVREMPKVKSPRARLRALRHDRPQLGQKRAPITSHHHPALCRAGRRLADACLPSCTGRASTLEPRLLAQLYMHPGNEPGSTWLNATPMIASIARRPFFSSFSLILSAATGSFDRSSLPKAGP